MRTELNLPDGKKQELAYAVEIIEVGFREAISRRTQERYRNGAILKIILFGSYARGDWVEDPIGRYFSDFDLLVVVNHEDLTDPSEFWGDTEQALLDALTASDHLRTPVSLIVHTLDDVNTQLRLGRYFFTDIIRDGVILREAQGHPFADPEPLARATALGETRAYFDEWFESAARFLHNSRDNCERGWNKEAVFLLHQAAERLYHTLLLVQSLYSPKTHSLNRLRALCEEADRALIEVWPKHGKFERRCYELLRAAYVKARYSPKYRISAEELAWLIERVSLLQGMVAAACEERIAILADQASRSGSV